MNKGTEVPETAQRGKRHCSASVQARQHGRAGTLTRRMRLLRCVSRRGAAQRWPSGQRRGANRLTKILRRPAQLSGGRPATIVRLARLAGLSFVGLSTAFTPSAIPSLRPTNRALAGCVLRQTLLLLSRVCSCSTRGCVSRGRRGKAYGLDSMADVQLTSFSRARAADFLAGSAADPHRW